MYTEARDINNLGLNNDLQRCTLFIFNYLDLFLALAVANYLLAYLERCLIKKL